MNFSKPTFLICLILLFSSDNIIASHMMGGEITYQWLGGKKYEVTYRVYRDCRGIPFNTPIIMMRNGSGGDTMGINYTRVSIEDITPVCDKVSAPCNPTNQSVGEPGVELHTFKSTIDFDISPYKSYVDNGVCEVRISLEQCCRNAAITTITPGNFYMESMLNICTSGFRNSSPQFTAIGNLILICNQPFVYNIGAFDYEDYDSLTYELVNPLNSWNSNESFYGNFNMNLPMTPYCPPNPGVLNCRPVTTAKPPRGFYFNTENGDLILTPTKCDEVSVISIKVTEYRKDSTGTWRKIGFVTRDVQFAVKSDVNYKNLLPETKVNGLYKFRTGKRQCIDIETKDTVMSGYSSGNPGDTTSIRILNLPSGAEYSYTDSNAASKTGRFCWTIHDSVYLQLQNNSKTIPLVLEVKDNYCPTPGQIRQTIFIKVLAPDSSGFLEINTYEDINKDGTRNIGEKNQKSKLNFKDKQSSYYIHTNKDGIFRDSVGMGELTIGLASHHYFESKDKDTTIDIKFDSTYKLAFGHYRRHGIYGRIYHDQNLNCKFDLGEPVFKGIKVATDSNKYIGISDAEGLYFIKAPSGTYTLNCLFRKGELGVHCPSAKTQTVAVSVDTIYENYDFGIIQNPDFTNISVSASLGRIRRGFDATLKVYCTNKGHQTMRNVELHIPLDSNLKLVDVLDTSKSYGGGTTATIAIDSIKPFTTFTYDFKYNVPANKFKSNDRICFSVRTDSMTTYRDSVKDNNTYSVCGRVDAPYDPNDKSVSNNPLKTVLDNHISYTIRFQNTGTDTATRVIVIDTVDTRYLDLSGFELNWSDAPCEVAMTGNVIHFTFEEIMLPYLAKSGDKSIGSFNFSLGLKQGFTTEQSFKNKASIYFDFEEPIHTQDAHTDLLSPITITKSGKAELCGPSETIIYFNSNITTGINNSFILELSDKDGDFGTAVSLDTIKSSLSADSFRFFAPSWLSGNYKLRIRSTDPPAWGIPGSGIIDYEALLKPAITIDNNLNNYRLCEYDTLKLAILQEQYIYKVLKNGVELNDFTNIRSYSLPVKKGDQYHVVAKDPDNLCQDTIDMKLVVLDRPIVSAKVIDRKANYCEGEQITLKAFGAEFYSFFDEQKALSTHTKDSNLNIKLGSSTAFYVSGVDKNGCSNVSDTLGLLVYPLPNKPIITKTVNTLSVSHNGLLKWYRDGILLPDSINTLTKAPTGIYTVTVITDKGCEASSDPFTHLMTGLNSSIISDIKIYPNPASETLTIENPSNSDYPVTIYELSGRLVYSKVLESETEVIDIKYLQSGIYILETVNRYGIVQSLMITVSR
jgi:uncharacterized repeat protein (TIGR01451 family)